MTLKSQQIDGEFWFSAPYAATLLSTTTKKIEAMAVREIVRSRDEGGSLLIAEADVNRLRRDSNALADAKEAAKMPAYPRKGEKKMSSETVYVGDAPRLTSKVSARIGDPLKDQGPQ